MCRNIWHSQWETTVSCQRQWSLPLSRKTALWEGAACKRTLHSVEWKKFEHAITVNCIFQKRILLEQIDITSSIFTLFQMHEWNNTKKCSNNGTNCCVYRDDTLHVKIVFCQLTIASYLDQGFKSYNYKIINRIFLYCLYSVYRQQLLSLNIWMLKSKAWMNYTVIELRSK